jgi:hypothetical protein
MPPDRLYCGYRPQHRPGRRSELISALAKSVLLGTRRAPAGCRSAHDDRLPRGAVVVATRGMLADDALLIAPSQSGQIGFARRDVIEREPKLNPMPTLQVCRRDPVAAIVVRLVLVVIQLAPPPAALPAHGRDGCTMWNPRK